MEIRSIFKTKFENTNAKKIRDKRDKRLETGTGDKQKTMPIYDKYPRSVHLHTFAHGLDGLPRHALCEEAEDQELPCVQRARHPGRPMQRHQRRVPQMREVQAHARHRGIHEGLQRMCVLLGRPLRPPRGRAEGPRILRFVLRIRMLLCLRASLFAVMQM